MFLRCFTYVLSFQMVNGNRGLEQVFCFATLEGRD